MAPQQPVRPWEQDSHFTSLDDGSDGGARQTGLSRTGSGAWENPLNAGRGGGGGMGSFRKGETQSPSASSGIDPRFQGVGAVLAGLGSGAGAGDSQLELEEQRRIKDLQRQLEAERAKAGLCYNIRACMCLRCKNFTAQIYVVVERDAEERLRRQAAL
jgi:hypothetical protein